MIDYQLDVNPVWVGAKSLTMSAMTREGHATTQVTKPLKPAGVKVHASKGAKYTYVLLFEIGFWLLRTALLVMTANVSSS